jgi:hypothetical protein
MTQANPTQVQLSTTPDGAPDPGAVRKQHPTFKPVEVTGGALAAVTSAVVASSFGLGGTLVGVAVGSVVSSLGAAMYGSWLRRAGGRIAVTRTLVVRTVAGGRNAPDDPAALPPDLAAELTTTPSVEVAAPTRGRIRWQPVAALAALTFVLGLGTLTVAEAFLGRPASGGTGGTTVSRLLDEAPAAPARVPQRPAGSITPDTTTESAAPVTTTDAGTHPSTTAPSTTGTTVTTGATESATVTSTAGAEPTTARTAPEPSAPEPSVPESSAPAPSAEVTPGEG